jgi:hypothetical protein
VLSLILPLRIFAQDTTKIKKEIPKEIIKDTIPNAPKMIFLTTKEHFFGEKKKGETLDYTFEIKNIGKKPLQIYRIQTSCHCSTTEWTKTPIEYGQTAKITIHYNTKDEKEGDVRKTFLLMTNASNREEVFYFKGTIK